MAGLPEAVCSVADSFAILVDPSTIFLFFATLDALYGGRCFGVLTNSPGVLLYDTGCGRHAFAAKSQVIADFSDWIEEMKLTECEHRHRAVEGIAERLMGFNAIYILTIALTGKEETQLFSYRLKSVHRYRGPGMSPC